jgi:hypothetical protein
MTDSRTQVNGLKEERFTTGISGRRIAMWRLEEMAENANSTPSYPAALNRH